MEPTERRALAQMIIITPNMKSDSKDWAPTLNQCNYYH